MLPGEFSCEVTVLSQWSLTRDDVVPREVWLFSLWPQVSHLSFIKSSQHFCTESTNSSFFLKSDWPAFSSQFHFFPWPVINISYSHRGKLWLLQLNHSRALPVLTHTQICVPKTPKLPFPVSSLPKPLLIPTPGCPQGSLCPLGEWQGNVQVEDDAAAWSRPTAQPHLMLPCLAQQLGQFWFLFLCWGQD